MSLCVACGLIGYVRRHWAQAGNSCRAGAGDATAAGAGVGAGPGPAVIALGFRLWMTRHPGRAWTGSSEGGGAAIAGGALASGGASTA